MGTIIPFGPGIPIEPDVYKEPFISMSVSKGFDFDPDEQESDSFAQVCSEALGLPKGDYSTVPVTLSSVHVVLNKDRAIVGVVFPESSLQAVVNHA